MEKKKPSIRIVCEDGKPTTVLIHGVAKMTTPFSSMDAETMRWMTIGEELDLDACPKYLVPVSTPKE